jgi:hypothetical protein
MTTYNRATLSLFFETGDVPTGQNYSDLIDSCANIVDTSGNNFAGPIIATEIITPRVSATNANITGTLVAQTVSGSLINTTNLQVTGTVSAALINTTNLQSTGTVSAVNVYSGFFFVGNAILNNNSIVSAAGTTQTTGAICPATMCRLRGAADGSATGYRLDTNKTGWTQQLINENAVSANLWPPVGGQINALAVNAAFPLAANTSYTVNHTQASAYWVK